MLIWLFRSIKVLEKLMDEGVNCRIEDDIEVFLKDEYFRKFIENGGRKIFCVYGEKSSLIRTRYV